VWCVSGTAFGGIVDTSFDRCNGGPLFTFSEAISLLFNCTDQDEAETTSGADNLN